MKLKCLGSSSKGNGYIFETDTEALILELGVRLKEVKKALDFNVSKIVGAISSHVHGDHFGFASQYLDAGIDVYCSEETFKDSKITSYTNPYIFESNKKFNIGEFTILPFPVIHDVTCHGFLIHHKDMGVCCFITDSAYSPYKFSNLNQIMLEVNFSDEILNKNINDNKVHYSQKNRLMRSHLSLRTAKELLKANDLSKVNNIVLLHLSDRNADANLFQKEIKELTGKQVFIADKGLEIDFNLTPF